MAEAEGIPPTASVVVPGPSLNYVGQHVYGYSGIVGSDGTAELTLLEFTLGSGYAVALVEFDYGEISSVDFTPRIYLNNQVISQPVQRGGATSNEAEINPTPVHVIIPPFTEVKITMQSNSGGREFGARITGRVYGAV